MAFDVATRILQIRTIEEKIAALKEKHKEELKPFEDFAAKARGEVLQFLIATGQQNAKTPNGIGYKIQKISYSLENPAEFMSYVIDTTSWMLTDWKANKTATDAYRLAHGGKLVPTGDKPLLVGGDLPPGVKKSEEIVLGVRAPAKAKTVAEVTPLTDKEKANIVRNVTYDYSKSDNPGGGVMGSTIMYYPSSTPDQLETL